MHIWSKDINGSMYRDYKIEVHSEMVPEELT